MQVEISDQPPTPISVLSPDLVAGKLFHYNAAVQSVYDGDTITVDIDLGMHAWVHGEKVRLLRINAPEVKGASRPAGLASRDYLRSLIPDGAQIVIETFKDEKEKYGRYLAEVWAKNEAGSWFNVNDQMVQAGHAEYKDY